MLAVIGDHKVSTFSQCLPQNPTHFRRLGTKEQDLETQNVSERGRAEGLQFQGTGGDQDFGGCS